MGYSSAKLISELHKESFKDSPERYWSESDFKSLFEIKGTVAYLLLEAEELVGFALIRTILKEAEILTFCILPSYRGKSFGTFLLNFIKTDLKEKLAVKLFLEVRKHNFSAISLYQKLFFVEIAKRKDYYHLKSDKTDDALIFEYYFK